MPFPIKPMPTRWIHSFTLNEYRFVGWDDRQNEVGLFVEIPRDKNQVSPCGGRTESFRLTVMHQR